jgi:hypothetical protein
MIVVEKKNNYEIRYESFNGMFYVYVNGLRRASFDSVGMARLFMNKLMEQK